MNESTNNENVTPEVEELRKALDYANKSQDTWYRSHMKQVSLIEDTENFLKDAYAGTVDHGLKELIVETLRRLDRPTTKTLDVTITLTWTGTVEAPLDFDEDIDDLEADGGGFEPTVSAHGHTLDQDLWIDDADITFS